MLEPLSAVGLRSPAMRHSVSVRSWAAASISSLFR
jgi:hypothetical protein